MFPVTKTSDPNPHVTTVYQQLCTSYHAIDTFRARLLGFLPLASGTGILFLFGGMNGGSQVQGQAQWLLLPAGIFGFLITLGLFFYEIHGIRKCGGLIEAGKALEDALDIKGPFNSREDTALGFVNEPVAAGIIYSGVLAAWAALILNSTMNKAVWWGAGSIFVAGALGLWGYDCFLRNEARKRKEARELTNTAGPKEAK
jgi:hypothetical protein